MDVISVWRAYAHLMVRGHKFTETRGWPAPKSIIGTRIAIAATKQIKPEERSAFNDPEFQRYYQQTDLPTQLDDLPGGCIVGFINVNSCDAITEEDIDDLTEEERIFGWWELGRYAWRVRCPEHLEDPIPIRGAQGIWKWNAGEVLVRSFRGEDSKGSTPLRRDLPLG